jgi:hypothetical protein
VLRIYDLNKIFTLALLQWFRCTAVSWLRLQKASVIKISYNTKFTELLVNFNRKLSLNELKYRQEKRTALKTSWIKHVLQRSNETTKKAHHTL